MFIKFQNSGAPCFAFLISGFEVAVVYVSLSLYFSLTGFIYFTDNHISHFTLKETMSVSDPSP